MTAARTYGGWRRPRAPGLGPLGTVGTAMLGIGLVIVFIGVTINLVVGLVLLAVVVFVVGPMALKDRWGRTGWERVGEVARWRTHRKGRGHLYIAGPLSRTASSRCGLPGLAARIEAYDAKDAIGRDFVVLHHPKPGHVSTVIECAPAGDALVDMDQVDSWVAGWGAWLADLGHEPGVVGAQVILETAPDPGVRLRRAVEARLQPDAPAVATAALREVVETFPAGAASTSCRIAITWARQRPGQSRRPVEDVAVEIGTRLPELCAGLGTTGAGAARPVTTARLAASVRASYDPDVRSLIEEAVTDPEMDVDDVRVDWADAGPIHAEEHVGHYLHDGAVSVSWVMGIAPAGVVRSSVLRRLIDPAPEVAVKRVTLLYRPYAPDRAVQLVEHDVQVTRFQAQQRKMARARDAVDVRAADRAAEEEALGAGLVRFGMIVTATAIGAGPEELRRVVSVVEQLGSAARVRLRRARRSQAATFTAGLPLGLVLPGHLELPGEWREHV